MVSLKDIVEPMSNELNNSTLGWDVVVNYKESDINDLLKDDYHNDPKGHLTELNVDIKGYDADLNPYTVNFKFALGPPLIKFVGSGIKPSCTLTIPVDGGQTKTSKMTLPITGGVYEIQLSNLEMASMTGSADGSTLHPSDKPFIFPSQNSGSAIVTIDFGTSQDLSVKLNTVNDQNHNPQVDAHAGDLEKQIYKFFTDKENISSIQYKLASVDPAAPPTGYVSMQPKSFCFAAFHSEKFTTTILSLFIQTADVLTGIVTDLQSNWTGQWIKDYGVPPIPDSHSASIIFSSMTMHNSVVLPALKNQSVDAKDPTFERGQGLHYKILTHKTISRAEQPGSEHVGSYSVNLDDDANTLRLMLGQNGDYDSQASGSVKWNYTYGFTYGVTRYAPNPAGGSTSYDDDGTASVKNSLSKRSAFSDTLSDDRLEMNLHIDTSDWDKPSVTTTDNNIFKKVFGNNDGPKWFEDDLPIMPSFDLKMGSLYFFLTTNLLTPGEKVIKIDSSSSAGLRIPHDYYIVGNIISKK